MALNMTGGNATTEGNSTIDCFGRSPGPGEAIVTWQSAWFVIAAIAMNSVSSPNGMVLSFPSSWGEALRSSPIICLFDAIELTLFWLLAIILTGESPRVAARRVARVRFRDTVIEVGGQLRQDENGEDDQSLTRLRGRFWIAQAGFSIAALTQAIKLFACRGVFGFQECAAFYLYSWTVSQALILAAGSEWRTQSLPPLPPGRVRAFLSQGILPYVPLHVWAIIHHTSWLSEFSDALGDQILEGDLWKAPVSSTLWVLGMTLLVAVVPFVMYACEAFDGISLEQHHVQLLPLTCIAFFFTESMSTAAWRLVSYHYKLRHWGYPPQSYNAAFIWLDMPLCAFTKQTRDAIAGVIPLTLFITGSLQVCLLFILPTFPEEHIEEYLGKWAYHIATALLLALAHFELPFSQKISSRYRWARRIQFRKLLRVYVMPVMAATLIVVWAATLRTRVLVFLTMFTVYLVLLWSRRPPPFTSPLATPPATPSTKGPHGDRNFPVFVTGFCFVGLNLVWSLLWCWQIWDKFWPECTALPKWTEVFG